MINNRLVEPIKMKPHPSLRQMCTVLFITRHNFTWGSYRISGSAKRQMRSNFTLTAYNWKQFYGALKAVYGPQSSGSSPALIADGCTLLTDKDKIIGRWAEHFNNVIKLPSSINEEAIVHLTQVVINASLADSPTVEEARRAVKSLSIIKAPGSDSIPGKLYVLSGLNLIYKLTELFKSAWTSKAVSQEFKDATIVNLYKRKGKQQCCDSHWGISLLLTAGKVLACLQLNYLPAHLEHGLLLKSQCGFQEGHGTVDMVFATQQLQEKYQEQNQYLYSSFIDLTKAFNTVCCDGLWKILSKLGFPPKIITVVCSFNDGMLAWVLNSGQSSDAFPVTNGVKQGCVLALSLFSILFTATLSDAFSHDDDSLKLCFHSNRNLFYLRRLQAQTKVYITSVHDLLFADDCALNTNSEAGLQ